MSSNTIFTSTVNTFLDIILNYSNLSNLVDVYIVILSTKVVLLDC